MKEDRTEWIRNYRARHPECRLRDSQLSRVLDAIEKHNRGRTRKRPCADSGLDYEEVD